MNLDNQQNINWSSPNALIELIKGIETPLESIIKESNSVVYDNTNNSNKIIFSSSQQIKSIVDEIVKKVNNNKEPEPLIFQIYNSNDRVKSMCKGEVKSSNISKQDISWLKKMEDEVYKNIKQGDINLYDLSYNLSVSERQLHRKIKNLVYLTPNKYIRVLKLHKAKQLIDDYLYNTISQISYAVGYYDTYYFSKLFNQQYGVSPKKLLYER